MFHKEESIKKKESSEYMAIKKQFSIFNHLSSSEVKYVNPGAQYDEIEITNNFVIRKKNIDNSAFNQRIIVSKNNDDIN